MATRVPEINLSVVLTYGTVMWLGRGMSVSTSSERSVFVSTTGYCAHINYGPWNHGHMVFATIGAARDYFAREVAGTDYGTGTEEQVMDLHPYCSECSDSMNFHDYPLVRFAVGSRGGVVRTAV